MHPDKCKHKKWRVLTNSQGNRNGISQCPDCDLWLTHAERLNWESLKNQKNVSYISITLSIIAVVIAAIALFIKQ